MNTTKWKEKVAERIAHVAMDKAEKTVGKSLPISVYEVEVPKELKWNGLDEEA